MFHKDLKDGQDFEDSICAFVRIKYPKAYRVEGYFSGYDIVVPEKNHQIECKNDRKSQVTDNIAIEFACKGKPSGITSTTATHWIVKFYDNNKWNLAIGKTKTWRDMCEKESLRKVKGGDGWLAEMYLVPKKLLHENKDIKIKEFIQ